jgi:hypothetical protein
MNLSQDVTKTKAEISVAEIEDVKQISFKKDQWIDFNALSGWITEGGAIRSMTIEEFANTIGVEKRTLYRWRTSIPDFWERVNARRKVLGSETRLQRVWSALYAKAASGNPQAAALYLANHDPDFKMPTQKVENDVGQNLLALVNSARKKKVIEGEILEPENDNAGSSPSAD